MPYWFDWMKKNRNFPIPNRYIHDFYTDKYVESEIKKGRDPVELSKEKWEIIKKVLIEIGKEPLPSSYYIAISNYIGWSTCGLCIKSIETYERKNGKMKYGSDKCKVCPLSKIDQCTKIDSTYSKIDQIMTQSRIGYDYDEKTIMEMIITSIDIMIINLKKISNA